MFAVKYIRERLVLIITVKPIIFNYSLMLVKLVLLYLIIQCYFVLI